MTRVLRAASLLPLLAALLAGSALFSQEPFSVHDLLAMQRVSDAQPSPDGKSVVFVLRTTDLAANRGRTDLWSVGFDGAPPRQLTTHEASDSSPRWSPDSENVFFLSTRSGSSQVWRLPVAGGEARQVTWLPLDVGSYLVSPDGRHLGVTLEVFPDCPDLACTVGRLASKDAEAGSGVVFDELFIRHWDTWKEGRRSHLFLVDLENSESRNGNSIVDASKGLNSDVPSKPFGGAEEIVFSPDGRHVVFAARAGGTNEAWSTNFDLWLSPIDGTGAPVPLTENNPAWDTLPVFSPDGRSLAWTAMKRPGYESDRFGLRIARILDGRLVGEREVAPRWDRSVSSFDFSPDGLSIIATAADVGQTSLFSINIASGAVRPLVSQGTVSEFALSGERIVVAHNDLKHPAELFTLPVGGGDLVALTSFNKARSAGIAWGDFEQFSFAGWNEEKVHGFVVKPANYEPGKKYPVAFLIHGGPQGSFGNNFHYRWNPQSYAAAGFAAVMVDFHGSTGYGQAFTDSIRDDWGGKPLIDLQKGLAAALQKYSFLDGNRVCALGASYGGFMINWIAGNWPDRFRCLVNHDGLFDNRSMYYTTEELWFPEWDHQGPYFANPEGHEKHNPVRFVQNWKTPMLVVHGGLDFRVPETQGFATFSALQRRGIPSRLLYFRDENHWVLKPKNSIQWHEEVLAWLSRWLQ